MMSWLACLGWQRQREQPGELSRSHEDFKFFCVVIYTFRQMSTACDNTSFSFLWISWCDLEFRFIFYNRYDSITFLNKRGVESNVNSPVVLMWWESLCTALSLIMQMRVLCIKCFDSRITSNFEAIQLMRFWCGAN